MKSKFCFSGENIFIKWSHQSFFWLLTVESQNTLNLPREPILCPLLEEEAGEHLDRASVHTISFGRGSRIPADPLLCTWMTLWLQKARKWFHQMKYRLPKDHQKFHRRSLHVVGFQGTEEGEESFTARLGSSHHPLQKVCSN